jgi:hypothetical protein
MATPEVQGWLYFPHFPHFHNLSRQSGIFTFTSVAFGKFSYLKYTLFFLLLLMLTHLHAQERSDTLYSFPLGQDAKVTIDAPRNLGAKKIILICFALPNGNTTEQTMGKLLKPGDDWHYDIQHIRAQTKFIRGVLKKNAVVVAYFENTYKSWPAWKTHHDDYAARAKQMVDTVFGLMPGNKKTLYLSSHSGGGRFVFCYLDAAPVIPSYVERISFLDSDYGYDSSYLPRLSDWLRQDKKHSLNVFAYNDSVALYEGKPVVSATGGTWYRSHCMLNDLEGQGERMINLRNDSLVVFSSRDKRVQFFFKTNPEKKIYHTVQVELNGFIHSVLCGTKYDQKGYRYFDKRAYTGLIE